MLLHIDFDAFFSSLEERRKPELKGKPVIICAFTKEGKSGVVMTANYEARKYGIKSGMPLYIAKQKLPDAYYIEGDKKYYERISDEIMEELNKFGDLEVASIDEAYVEVDKDWDEAYEYAKRIKHEVEKKFGIKLSVGIGRNIVNAKIASRLAKPDGVYRLKSIREIKDREVSIIPGIGEKTKEKLNEIGITTIGELIEAVEKDKEKIIKSFGEKTVKYLFNVANDKGREKVEDDFTNSLGKIITLKEESEDKEVVRKYLDEVIRLLYEEKARDKIYDGVKVIVFFKGYEVMERSKKIKASVGIENIIRVSHSLLDKIFEDLGGRKIRRIGVFVDIKGQQEGSLFDYF